MSKTSANINFIYKYAKKLSKDKREGFIKLALQLVYLDDKINKLEVRTDKIEVKPTK